MAINPTAEIDEPNAEDYGDGEREKAGFGKDELARIASGYSDPSGQFPSPDYLWKPSLNKVAVGEGTHSLSMGGGDPFLQNQAEYEQINNSKVQENLSSTEADDGHPGIDAFGGDGPDIMPQYTRAQIQQTKSGHVIMMDDTPSGEKILIKHNKGNGIEFASDGSVMIRSKNKFTISVDTNGVMIFEGDLTVSCQGLTADVTGDLDLNVGGDFNLKVGGDKKETIQGASRSTIDGNRGEMVKGNKSSTTLGSKTNTTLGQVSDIIKGNLRQTIGAALNTSVKGQLRQSSETEIATSAPNQNIAAADLTVIGATGTIGGKGMIMYNQNSYTGSTVHAGLTVSAPVGNISRLNGTSAHYTTFHGSLNGTALEALNSNQAKTAGSGTASPGGYSITNSSADNIANSTIKSIDLPGPTPEIMTEYLTQSNRGIQKVSVDDGDFIRNKIDRSVKMGGVADKKLTTAEARAKIKNPANLDNMDFMTALIADGSINSNYLKPLPDKTGRTFSPGKTAVAPSNPIRQNMSTKSSKVIGGQRANITFIPDPAYNPQAIDPRKGPYAITSKTLLAKGMPISTFLAGAGRATSLGHLGTFVGRQIVARNLLVQAEVMKLARRDEGLFEDYRLKVVEGVYKPVKGENRVSGGINDLSQMGQVITYELYNSKGIIDPSITFEFAEMLCNNLGAYDEIRLYYDNLDPRGKTFGGTDLNAQIMVIGPYVLPDYLIKTSKFGAATYYNGKVQSATDLIEIGTPSSK
jgi:hypothetical protein|tara:strand:- start:1253 stop:3502 length:2250 start_codon:yes stop_codon:yes gene_type:complete